MRTVHGCADRVVIVGAGLAGLSTALHLATTGRTVTVLEQGSRPGGKAGVFTRDGYTFDNGPTVLTMPDLIRETFAAVGERMEDHLELLPVHPAYRARYHDGSSLDVHTDPAAMAQEIARVCGAREAAGYRRLHAFLQELYTAEFDHFVDRNIDSPLDLSLPALGRLAALGAFRGMEGKIRQYLNDPRTVRLFSFQALYAGVAPHQARALYAIISYMDTVAGVFFPKGGMHALPLALADAARRHGVTLRYDTPVERVETTLHGRARAVLTTSGDRIPADAVVITTDPSLAFPELLGRSPVRVGRLRHSPSCVLLLAGAKDDNTDALRPEAHHTIHFARSWRRGFDEIIHGGRPMSDPSFLVSTPTRTDPTLAPAGHHSHYVLFPTPNLTTGSIDWERDTPRYREQILTTLDAHGYHELAARPQAEHLLTPRDWAERGCPAGTPFSAAHTFFQTGPFRTRNLVGENIVLAGAGTHPGVGIPMALISGRLAAQRITGPTRTRPHTPAGVTR
ncbi:phytoene dehydrogenase [Streptomyces finlayi]|uniref:Phytoene dehydrogenase n=1 Tax=Streptomyces finlayi TaxID=67296 RepID=A0A918XA16_9ACTN|nr:phytoene desaturase family protein [Streptomyces finlayi]GHD18610.1 phytoene dehydrogenase [Streptomyces finlayi]